MLVLIGGTPLTTTTHYSAGDKAQYLTDTDTRRDTADDNNETAAATR